MSFSMLRTVATRRALSLAAPHRHVLVRNLNFMPIYVAETTVQGARNGHLTSKSGSLDLKLDMPKEFGTKGGPGTNPEELFAGAYAACFGGALAHSAGTLKLNLAKDTTVKGVVSIGPKTPKGFQLAVELQVSKHGLSDQDFETLVKDAHLVCPFSHAVKDNIDVLTINK